MKTKTNCSANLIQIVFKLRFHYDFDFDFADDGFEAEGGFGAEAEALGAGGFCEGSGGFGDAGGGFGVFDADECWYWLIPLPGRSFPCDALLI